MRIIARIDDPGAIERILLHLDAWEPGGDNAEHSGTDPPWPDDEALLLTDHRTSRIGPDAGVRWRASPGDREIEAIQIEFPILNIKYSARDLR